MSTQHSEKRCFVICPIGDEGSSIRGRADKVFRHVILPVAEMCGYEVTRADKISKPGRITSQIIEHLLQDDLVVADLTGHNPNVFYELAIRHTIKKPVIQMIEMGDNIPFDVGQERTIILNHQDLDSVDDFKRILKQQIESIEGDPSGIDSPISAAIDLKALRQSENLLEKNTGEIITKLSNLQSTIDEIRSDKVSHEYQPIVELYDQLQTAVDRARRLSRSATSISDELNAWATIDGENPYASIEGRLETIIGDLSRSIEEIDSLVYDLGQLLPYT